MGTGLCRAQCGVRGQLALVLFISNFVEKMEQFRDRLGA